MKVESKQKFIGKKGPKINQNKPVKRYRCCTNTKETKLSDLIRANKISKIRPHRRSATLSTGGARALVGRKINKGNSCTSAFQKRKQLHAITRGSHYRELKTLKKCYKIRRTEVSHKFETLVKLHSLRRIKIKLIGHGNKPNRVPNKIFESRLLTQDEVRNRIITNKLVLLFQAPK